MKHHHFHYSFTGGMGEGIQSVEGDFQPASAMQGALDEIRAAGFVGNIVLLGWQEMTPEQSGKYRQFLAKRKVPLDALVASARNPTKAYTATVAPKPDDVAAIDALLDRHGVAHDNVEASDLESLSAEELAGYELIFWPGGWATTMSAALKEKP